MPYNLETYQEPFWAKSGNFVRGRDPLGIQNSSISVYASLLPGMTNLTQRLRYYGFYLYLLDEYKKLPNNHEFKQSPKGQFKYVRRAELIIAFVMQNLHPSELAVIGSTYTNKYLDEAKENGFYDIALGADQNKDTKKGSVYWDYSSGALGQYYVGSLLTLNLIEACNGYFERTEDYGKELADVYRSSLTSKASELFQKRILEGKLYSEDIKTLDQFSLNQDYKNTSEGDFYRRMLLSNDGLKNKTASNTITSQRKESMKLFLEVIKDNNEEVNWQKMPWYCYNELREKNKTEVSDSNFGWYFYYLNELAHHSLEAVFWGLLMEMDGNSYSINQFLTVVVNKVSQESEEILKDNGKSTLSEIIQTLSKEDFEVNELIVEIDESVKANDSYKGILRGILSLICLYRENEHKLQEVQEYAVEHFLDTKNGNALAIFKDYIENSKHLSFKSFVRKLIHTLIHEHIAVAYAKMGNGEKNLLKFVLEDNYLVHVETIKPNFTNPRLKTLYNFTRDLGLVNKNGQLTSEGEALLTKINNEV